jgi:hypothetical protein
MNEAMDFDPVIATQLWEDTKDETGGQGAFCRVS